MSARSKGRAYITHINIKIEDAVRRVRVHTRYMCVRMRCIRVSHMAFYLQFCLIHKIKILLKILRVKKLIFF